MTGIIISVVIPLPALYSLIRKQKNLGKFPQERHINILIPVKTSDRKIFIDEVAEGLREIKIQDEITVNTIYDINGNNIKNIETILVDTDNNLWMGTGNGLLEYDHNTKV